jgi:hypothetical protein
MREGIFVLGRRLVRGVFGRGDTCGRRVVLVDKVICDSVGCQCACCVTGLLGGE